MNRLVITVALLGTLAARSLHAQGTATPQIPDSTTALVHQLVERSKSVDLTLTTVEANVAAQRRLNPNIPPVFWDRFLTLVHQRRDDLGKQIESVYARHFSASELRGLIAFYDSPLGKKLMEMQPTIAQESMEVGRQWGSQIGMEVARQIMADSAKAKP